MLQCSGPLHGGSTQRPNLLIRARSPRSGSGHRAASGSRSSFDPVHGRADPSSPPHAPRDAHRTRSWRAIQHDSGDLALHPVESVPDRLARVVDHPAEDRLARLDDLLGRCTGCTTQNLSLHNSVDIGLQMNKCRPVPVSGRHVAVTASPELSGPGTGSPSRPRNVSRHAKPAARLDGPSPSFAPGR